VALGSFLLCGAATGAAAAHQLGAAVCAVLGGCRCSLACGLRRQLLRLRRWLLALILELELRRRSFRDCGGCRLTWRLRMCLVLRVEGGLRKIGDGTRVVDTRHLPFGGVM